MTVFRAMPDAAPDPALMSDISAGEPDALATLYARYGLRAYRVAWSVCRDAGRAEEAVQEAFLSIWRHASTYRAERGPVAPWLLTVVRHSAQHVTRRHRGHADHRADEELLRNRPASGELAADAAGRAQAKDLLGLLSQLPEAQRDVIVLAFYGELSHQEIAACLGLPAGTVKGRMRLGLQKLRAETPR